MRIARLFLTPIVLGIVGLSSVGAQQVPQPSLKFEVASVKPHVFMQGDRQDFTISGNSVKFSVASLYALVREAYDIKMDRISGGPAWASRVRDAAFDIEARVEGTPTTSQVRLMLQQLLAERFQLKAHRESREIAIYQLVVAKGSSKLAQSASSASDKLNVQTRVVSPGVIAREYASDKMSIATLADVIASSAGRPVEDRTGLDGTYAVRLSWTDDSRVAGTQATAEVPGPSIFTALEEQLGLKLESGKGPGEFLVIDSVEKPSAN